MPTDTGTRCVEVYNLEGQIGQGTYGSVYSATCKYRPGRFALKRIHPSKSSNSLSISFYREIVVLRQITHQNLVPLLEIVTSKHSVGSSNSSSSSKDSSTQKKEDDATFVKGDLYMVFEYMDHDMAGLLNAGYKFSVPQIRCLMHQLLEVLDYLHTEKQLMHRDIKCSNLLVGENMQLKLADFGLARFANREDGRYTNRVITLWYRPPELLLGEEHYTYSVDIWSVGCIMAELLLGFPAFVAKKETEQLDVIWGVCGTPTEDNWPTHKTLPMWNNPYMPKHSSNAQMTTKWKQMIVSEIEKRRLLFDNPTNSNKTVSQVDRVGNKVSQPNEVTRSDAVDNTSDMNSGSSKHELGGASGETAENVREHVDSHADGGGTSPADTEISLNDASAVANSAIKLLERLLALDPSRRFSARAAKEDVFFMSDKDSLHWQNLDTHQKIDTGGSFHEWETKQMMKDLPGGKHSKDRRLLVNNKRPRDASTTSEGHAEKRMKR